MYIRSHHLRHHLPHHRVGSSLWLAAVLRFMGQSMLLFFLLLYLFTVGFSPVVIFGYGVVLNLAGLLLNHWVVGRVVSLIGPRKTIALGNIALIAFAFGLYALPVSLPYLYALAVVQALATESYFLGQHAYLVAKTSKGESGGRQVGGQLSAEPFGYMLGPLTAGLVAWVWSAQAVNFVAGAVLVVGVFLAFFFHDKSVQDKHRYSHHRIWQIYRQLVSDWRSSLMAGAAGGFLAVYELFSLYRALFILIVLESSSNYGLLGLFAFVGSLVGLIATLRVGRRSDGGRSRNTLRNSVIWEWLINFGRIGAGFLPGWARLVFMGVYPPLAWGAYESRNVLVYKRAYEKSERFADAKVEYSVCLENLGALTRLLVYSLACLLSLAFSLQTTLLIAFGLAFILNSAFLVPPARTKLA